MNIGRKAKLTDDAIKNYGEQYRDIIFVVTHAANKYMPAKEFYAKNRPNEYHPGYDSCDDGMYLYDFDGLAFSLYEYEIEFVD